MTGAGLFERRPDLLDRPRVFMALSDRGGDAMRCDAMRCSGNIVATRGCQLADCMTAKPF